MKEYLERLNIAQAHFDWATDPEEVDAAIAELRSVELAMSNYVKGQKENEVVQVAQI